MSDSESNAPTSAVHATQGGKSLASLERPRYKSWRKKYRKMRYRFDGVLEENKKLFKDEQKLEGIAKRLREELDELLDLLLDVNSNPALPPELRFNISLNQQHSALASIPSVVPEDITPQAANDLLMEYTVAVQRGQIPNLDLNVIRHQLDDKLATQGTTTIDELAAQVSHTVRPRDDSDLPDDIRGIAPPSLLSAEEEDAYILRLDARLGDPVSLERMKQKEKEEAAVGDEKHWAELTPREVERQIELQNPQSQHNWLKMHAKNGVADVDDAESLADAKPASGRGGKGKRDLAKQVGDRAVGRAREGFSPSAASAGFGDEDELSFVDDHPAAGRKRAKGDVDGPYRAKGGKATGSKGKRKRSGEDLVGMPTTSASAKKAKVEAAE